MLRKLLICCALAACFAICPVATPATVDFESPPVGTVYGSPAGHSPGDVVLTEDGIDMSVESFFQGTYTGFNNAEVGGWTAPAFPTTPLTINNISVKFHLSGLGVNHVTLEYADHGGPENIAVNGGTIYEVPLFSSAPSNIAPGVVLSVTETPMSDHWAGVITLIGPMTEVLVGGQELGIDNLIATPEPGALALLGIGVAFVRRRRDR
ncbi:MAG: PEP-CTERM sorting domain-containing protein [bacterium]|nr:PEP-CTERM sorting domain-containing protein [bacterium]